MQSRRRRGRSFRLELMPARFHLLHAGYIRDSGTTVGSSVSLIVDEGALIVVVVMLGGLLLLRERA